MSGLRNIAVYEWQAWDLFLISNLVDPSCRVKARYGDDVDVIAPAFDAGIDAILLQFDLSHCGAFPRRRSEIIAYCRGRGVPVLNATIGDITKRNLYTLLADAGLPSARAEPNGDPDDWLFIKSNLNAGGQREARFEVTRHDAFGFSADAPIMRADEYYRTQRRQVEPALWQDRHVVIERYIVNPENSFYRMYRFGEAVVVVKGHSHSLIKKLSGHSDDRNYPATMAEVLCGKTEIPARLNAVLAKFLTRHDVEYCAVDVVHDADDFYIVDLNLTPYSGTEDENEDMVAFMQEGALRYVQALRAAGGVA